MTDRSFRTVLLLSWLLGVLTQSVRPLRALLHPLYRGLVPYRGSEEAMYYLRLQEALRHPLADATNGIWSTPSAPPGMQMAGIEQVLGWLFGWTGIAAPHLTQVLTVIIAPLMLPLFAVIARRFGVSRGLSLLGALLFYAALGFPQRFFHPGFSQPLVMLGFWLLVLWWESSTPSRAVLTGAVLGYVVSVYFWAWTFLWATAGVLLLFAMVLPQSPVRVRRLKTFAALGATALVFASPSLLRMVVAAHSPFFRESSARVGLAYSRDLESLPRSVLLFVLAGAAAWLWRRREDREWYAVLLSGLIGLALVFSQQLVHGRIMSFSSHYYQYAVMLGALALLAIAQQLRWRQWAGRVASACAGILIFFAFRDYATLGYAFSPPDAASMAYQHLASLTDLLNRGQRRTILTDQKTADILASYTDQDVVFTEYSNILLIPDREYYERYCLSRALSPRPPEPQRLVVLAEEALRVARGHQTQELYDAHLADALRICRIVKRRLASYMAAYGVTHVVWNERREPDWSPDSLLLMPEERGDGWSLWRVREPDVR